MSTSESPRVNYAHTVEALGQAVKDDLTPELLDALANMGIDFRATLKPEYEMSVWGPCLRYMAQQIFRDQAPDEALRRLGVRFVSSYARTGVGRAAFGFLRLLGPRRGLSRVESSFRTGGNYIETRSTDVGPGAVDLWVNEELALQPFTQGILEEGLRLVGVPQPRVRPTRRGPREVTFEIRWDEDA